MPRDALALIADLVSASSTHHAAVWRNMLLCSTNKERTSGVEECQPENSSTLTP